MLMGAYGAYGAYGAWCVWLSKPIFGLWMPFVFLKLFFEEEWDDHSRDFGKALHVWLCTFGCIGQRSVNEVCHEVSYQS